MPVRMRKLYKDSFLFGTILFWVFATLIVLFFSKAEIHLYLNQFHTPFFDWIFKNVTYLGDGAVIAIVGVLLALIRVRYGLLVIVTMLTSGIITQFLKRVVFSDVLRPKGFFKDIAELYFVPGVDVHSSKSFPSGHTTSAFAFFAALALIAKYQYARLFFVFMAILTGYSRIYLSQHFLVDVLVGSIIGTLTSYFMAPLFKAGKTGWMDYSVLQKRS